MGLSESGVKKALNADDGAFSRVTQLGGALGLSLEDLLALADAAPAPWRLTEAQEVYFREDPRRWWFLLALSERGWAPEAVAARHGLAPEVVEGWLAGLERRGVIRRTEGGRVLPDDAAGRPWQAGPRFGDAVTAPAQDALLVHARSRIRDRDAHPYPGLTECGFGRLALTEGSLAEFKQALRAVVAEFADRSRREQLLHPEEALIPAAVMTVMAPFSLPAPDAP